MIVNVLKLNYILYYYIIIPFELIFQVIHFYTYIHDELHAYINTYIAFFTVEIFIYSIHTDTYGITQSNLFV